MVYGTECLAVQEHPGADRVEWLRVADGYILLSTDNYQVTDFLPDPGKTQLTSQQENKQLFLRQMQQLLPQSLGMGTTHGQRPGDRQAQGEKKAASGLELELMIHEQQRLIKELILLNQQQYQHILQLQEGQQRK